MLTWFIAPATITFLFVAAIVGTVIARRRSDQSRDVSNMYQRSVRVEEAAAHRAKAEHL